MDYKKYIDQLRSKINQWNIEYYGNDKPTVSDYEYDLALKELFELEEKFPKYKTLDSPTLRVGGVISEKFIKIMHNYPMLSLSNAFNNDDLIKFDNDIKNILKDEKYSYFFEPKIDGLGISLIYENGYLIRALTRGDGEYGEDVTINVRTIKSIPLKIDFKELIEIRGEIFVSKKNFLKMNKNSSIKFANSRNAASGTIRNLNSSIVAKRNLDCIVYYIPNSLSFNLRNQSDVIEWLKKHGFKTSLICDSYKNINDILSKIEQCSNLKETLDYDIDGLVIKLNQIDFYDKIGNTSKFPKWAIAYKFPANIEVAKLESINITIGRTGKVNYIATISPTMLNNTLVTKATLHNYDYIKTKNIMINDKVKVFKAGEIIPKIIEPVLENRSNDAKYFDIPTNCPSCYSVLVKPDNEVDLYCLNERCDSKIIESIIHFCSRDAMGIEGLSKKIIKKFYLNKIISNAWDLYDLEKFKDKILNLDLKIKEKSFSKLLFNINLSKNKSLEKLIFALGIRHIGEVASKDLAKKFLNLFSIEKATYDQLILIDSFGPSMANSIVNFFKSDSWTIAKDAILKNNINVNYISAFNNKILNTENKRFSNRIVLITGSFSQSRNEIKEILENVYNCQVVSNLSNRVNLVLSGNKATDSKLEKAKSLNIEIISEEFWK